MWITSGLATCAGDLDLRLERAALFVARSPVAEVVEPGLAHGRHLRARRKLGDVGRRRIVEPRGGVRVAADAGEHARRGLGGGDRLAVRPLVEADREDPLHAGGARRGHQLGIVGLAEAEVGVGIDHGRSLGAA